MRLVLGSSSPRRRELLERMGLRFRVLTADIDETKYETEDPEASVRRICEAKANAVAQAVEAALTASGGEPPAQPQAETLILTADTVVVLDGRILGKPRGEAEAKAMLRALSGREHAVYTAFTLRPAGGMQTESTHCEKTLVKFRELTDAEIDTYVDSGEPMDKAGAYGIQGLGAMLVEGIRGDYFTVMGLPVCKLCVMLKRYGIDPLSKREKEL